MNLRHLERADRRQLMTAGATLGVATWLLSACAGTSDAAPAGATGQTSAGSTTRRRLGPLEVFPIGLGVQWHPGRNPQDVNDLYASSTDRSAAIALIRRAVDVGVTLFDTAEAY